jgi:PST family polysaccharide transporter
MLARAAFWSAANTAFMRLGQLGISVVIARLVSPHEFGVFVVALITFQIVINISEIGVSAALVREVDNADRIAPTVSTIAIVTSAILAGGMFLAAPLLASSLGAPAATDAVRVLALPLLLAGPTAVPAALLARDFHQGRKMAADFGSFVVSNGLLLMLAWHGYGVMALAWSRVAGHVVSAILLFLMTSHRYRPGFDPTQARRLLRFGLPLAGSNLAGFTLANVDFMVIGRLAGSLQLGYYNLAFTVSSWPPNVFTVILYSVTLPALARVKGGIREMERHLAAALSAASAASFPVTALCAVLAHPLITLVYGARWAPSAAILVVLALFGSPRVIISLFSDVLVAVDRTRHLFRLQMLWLVALAPAMILAVYLGAGVGAGIAQVVVAVGVVLPAYVFVLVRTVGLSMRVLLRPAGYPLVAAVAGSVAAYLVAGRFEGPLAQLLAGTGAFTLVYLLVLGRWLLRLKRELVHLYGRAKPSGSDQEPAEPAGPAVEPATEPEFVGNTREGRS